MPDQWLVDAGKLVFHTVGDTGGVNDGAAQQTLIAHAMQAQVQAVADSDKPAFSTTSVTSFTSTARAATTRGSSTSRTSITSRTYSQSQATTTATSARATTTPQ
jgi:hypothetical protein